jgi:hypothetical protein
VSRVAGHRTALRLLLLGVVAAGVVGMHTLGHSSAGGHHCGATHPGASARHDPHVGAAVAGSASDASVVGVGRCLDPSSVCLAILVTFGLAALLAALVMTVRRPRARGRYRHRIPFAAGRGPPPLPRSGLRLADLSVLRI